MEPSVVHVAVGVVVDAQGRILLARRHERAHQGGKWEFPGGKVEPGENVDDALRRELAEELDIRVRASQPLVRVPYDYGDKRVLLDVHRVGAYEGQPRGLEGQPLRWVPPGELCHWTLPPANRPITAVLALPRQYLITPEVADRDTFLAGVEQALAGGVRFVQLRRHDLPRPRYLELAAELARLCRAKGAVFAANAQPALALEAGAQACHLSAAAAASCAPGRRPVPLDLWLGVSCHDAGEIRHALALQADYLLVSPVRATPTHPHAMPLGWQGLRRLIRDVPVPVYALGGVGPRDLACARRYGAHGVAAVRALWPAPD